MIPRARVVPTLFSALLAAAALTACSDTTELPGSQLNLDRPVDMAFACYGGLRITNGADPTKDDPIVVSAQPIESCNFRSGPPVDDHAPVPFGQGEVGGLQPSGVFWYGLILESGPGTVAVARFQTAPVGQFASDASVRDANKLTPGTNGISVGEDPVAITTDKLGCHAITANAGSCDLSVLDLTSALDEVQPVFKVDRRTVRNSLGQAIHARPAAMVAEPPGGQIGVACPAEPGGIVYVAYPNCHLVAAVSSATGTIVGGIQYDELGVPSLVGGDVSCPAECGGGGVFTPGPRPVTLDLELDERSQTRRLVIGSDNSPSFSVVELDIDSLPLSVSQVALENTTGNLGITQIALSPTIGIGGAGSTDVFDDGASGGDFQFVYAIATDHTVRVADILSLRKECDTQVDPRFLRGIQNVRQLGCLAVGDPTTPPRRATASGPGIQAGIPLSLEIVRSQKVSSVATSPDVLIGYFAIVTTAGGGAFVINIDDDIYSDTYQTASPLAVTVQDAIAHQLRDAVPLREALSTTQVDDPNNPENQVTVPLCKSNGPVTDDGAAIAGPRAASIPARNIPVGNVGSNKVTELPYFRQLKCVSEAEGLFSDTDAAGIAITELSFSAPADVRDHEFPDLHSLARDETWTITWEGSLSQDQVDDAVDGPGVRESQLFVDTAGIRLVDQTRPFCDAGVEPFDIVQLRGCDPSVGNLDCPSGYLCYVHPESQVQGIGACLLADEAERLKDSCKDFLTSQRRYTVRSSNAGELELVPRRRELKTTPLDGCTSDAQCEMLADYSKRLATTSDPNDPANQAVTDPKTWACHTDSTRSPIPPNNKRCFMKCNKTTDCELGTICQGAIDGQNNSGFCLEGIAPPQACVNAPQRYELRAGEAFAVVGTQSGFIHPVVADPSGKCVRHPNASAYITGRIPLDPPACDPTADPLTGRLPNGTFDKNPCSTTTVNVDIVPNYDPAAPDSCQFVPGAPEAVLSERPAAPAIVFRNPGLNLTLVDPYYPGDRACNLDRQGNLGRIPHVVPGFQLAFRQVGGFSTKGVGLPASSSVPVKVVRGPLNSVWIIDEGDFLSQSATASSTRGKVYQFMPHSLAGVTILQ